MGSGTPSPIIAIEGANLDVGGSFRDHARQTILRTASKYFGRLSAATVHLSREGVFFRCTVNIQMGALKVMSAEFQHRDCYFAFRNALERVEKQLRRAKRELREDKASRVDKDWALRDGLRAHPRL